MKKREKERLFIKRIKYKVCVPTPGFGSYFGDFNFEMQISIVFNGKLYCSQVLYPQLFEIFPIFLMSKIV